MTLHMLKKKEAITSELRNLDCSKYLLLKTEKVREAETLLHDFPGRVRSSGEEFGCSLETKSIFFKYIKGGNI